MYGILVVDDEYTIRNGIVHAIPWESCGAQVVGEAVNGVEALKCVGESRPDIVITDIHMDDMDGLELAETLKERYPDIRVIILTGYDEFEYAKKALQLKVYSYLLKPVLPQELIQIVSEVISEIEADVRLKDKIRRLESAIQINREVYREKLLYDLIHGNIAGDELKDRLTIASLENFAGPYTCLILNLDGYYELTHGLGTKRVQIILQCIIEAAAEVWGSSACAYIDNGGNVVSIVGGIGDHYARIEKLKQAVGNAMDITISVAIGGTYDLLLDVCKSYSEAAKALGFKTVTGKDCIIHIHDVNAISGECFIYPEKCERMILAGINDNDKDRVRMALHAFFDEICTRNYTKEWMRICVMEFFAVAARQFMDLGVDVFRRYRQHLVDPYKIIDRLDTVEELENWICDILMKCLEEVTVGRNDNVKSVIKRAQQYIEENFSNPDISLNRVAEYVYLNPAYLSKLYKQETGETYMEYLTRQRMGKAKELLQETNIKISNIGISVGYPNSQYFATLFKRMAGLTPVEYRETIMKGSA